MKLAIPNLVFARGAGEGEPAAGRAARERTHRDYQRNRRRNERLRL